MTNLKPLFILSVTIVVSLALSVCAASKDASAAPVLGQQGQKPVSSSLASKLVPQRTARTARSLSEMFEKVKSKIFGGKKQGSAGVNQMQASASVNPPQRQPWADINSFNQQYSPYSSLNAGYQWPVNSNQYMNQYSPLNSYMGSQSGSSGYPGLAGVQSQQNAMLSGLDSQSQSQSSLIQAANPSSSANGGLLSSASHLIAQYLSPTSAGSSGQVQQAANGQQALGQSNQVNGANPAILTPQQQSQNQYSEFASILDSMVAQTGATAQRQPNLNQYLANQAQSQQGQQGLVNQQPMQGQQSGPGNMMIGDNDMSGSSNIQSYMPASPQQASQKSSMVSLAEQLAPGAQFNKLVSFPFSLSSNEDPSKEGRYKLHIPFLNQHVKRSDQQQAAASNSISAQQQQQNYLNSYYSQQQPASSPVSISQQSQQHQLKAQASQLIPTILSPQSSSSSSSASQSQSYSNSPVSVSSAISAPVSSVVSSPAVSGAAPPSVPVPSSS